FSITRLSLSSAFSLTIRPPPTSTLFPYTSLFRSDPRLPLRRLVVHGRSMARRRQRDRTRRLSGVPPRLHVVPRQAGPHRVTTNRDRKSTRLNSSHVKISYAVFCLKKKKKKTKSQL